MRIADMMRIPDALQEVMPDFLPSAAALMQINAPMGETYGNSLKEKI